MGDAFIPRSGQDALAKTSYHCGVECDRIKHKANTGGLILRHIFIVNPAAGKGKAMDMVPIIEKSLKQLGEDFSIIITERAGHATELAKEISKEGLPTRIYPVGGDGTLNEVVNGISGDHIELGIIPCGSGNDTSRSIYQVTDPIMLIEKLPRAQSRSFDLGMINDRYFLNIASVGFDAEVVLQVRRIKRIPLISGSMAYILGVITALIHLKHYKVKLSIDDGPQRPADLLLCAFANGRFYGGGMLPVPHADLQDGLLDLCEVRALGRRKILRFFPAFKKGQHTQMEEVHLAKFKTLTLESPQPIPVNSDGEVIEEARVSIKVLPGHIRVLVPE